MIKYLKQNIIYLFLILISLLSSTGAVVYYVYKLNNLGIIISLVISIVLFSIISNFHYKKFRIKEIKSKYLDNEKTKTKNKKLDNFLLIIYFLLFTFYFFTLYYHHTTQSIISPWQVVPWYFFLTYFLITLLLIIKVLNNTHFSLLLISAHLLLSSSIAWVVYKIGYGFDPFIHEATMDLILKTGEVTPKPFYYLGQYSFIVIIQKITSISLIWLNKLLVPTLASILLPYSIYKFLSKYFENKKIIFLTLITLLIIPYSLFILTTPQNLSYLFLIITIFLGLTCSTFIELIIIYLLSITTALIHPIAGIPAFLYAILITIYNSELKSVKKYLYLLTYLLSIIALPAAFYFINGNGNASETISENSNNLFSIKNLISVPSRENFVINFVYLYIFNIKFIITILVLAGIFLVIKYKDKCIILFINIFMSLALLASYILVKNINFSFLIDYEREDYANRILVVAVIILLPIIYIALYNLVTRILSQNKYIKFILLIFLAVLITTSLYATYPRYDRYHNSHGYSVSQSDISAVNWIEDNHENDYIVLANQQVSVGALREFGFSKYLKDDVYFYPIPTGGDLYQYYLQMVYEKPKKETMTEAMEFAGVNEAYFVLNKYWWAFPKLLEEAKHEADSWEEIDSGNIYIFKYVK